MAVLSAQGAKSKGVTASKAPISKVPGGVAKQAAPGAGTGLMAKDHRPPAPGTDAAPQKKAKTAAVSKAPAAGLHLPSVISEIVAMPGNARLKHLGRLADALGSHLQVDQLNHFLR